MPRFRDVRSLLRDYSCDSARMIGELRRMFTRSYRHIPIDGMCYFKPVYYNPEESREMEDGDQKGAWCLDLMVHEERPVLEDELLDNPRPARCGIRWVFANQNDYLRYLPNLRITGRRYKEKQTLGYTTEILVRVGIGSWSLIRYEQRGKTEDSRPDIVYRPFINDADRDWYHRKYKLGKYRVPPAEEPQKS